MVIKKDKSKIVVLHNKFGYAGLQFMERFGY